MAAPDFFENFLLHDGLKALRPQENPLIVPLSRQRRYRQADTPQAASIRLWGRGGLASSPPVGAAFAPASVSPHYAGKSRATPGNSAFHAKKISSVFQGERRAPGGSTSRARMCSSVVCPSQCAI